MSGARKRDCIYDVVLIIQGKQIHTKALYDTGNCLREGKDRRPVSLLEGKALEALGDLPLMACKPGIVRYHTIGGDGTLFKIQADCMIIKDHRRRRRVRRPSIAIYTGALTPHGAYRMLLHPEHFR